MICAGWPCWRRACVEPVLVILPSRRRSLELSSDGTRPKYLISCPARGKRSKSPTSAHRPTADGVSTPRRQRSHATVVGRWRVGHELADRRLQLGAARDERVDRAEVVVQR